MKEKDTWYNRAKECLPGGVNSPVRSFGAVGGTPVFIHSAKGNKLKDERENIYLDYITSWGPMILGHGREEVVKAIEKQLKKGVTFGAATTLEVEMAEYICARIPNIEMVRMVNSGTEAVMSAIRLARGYTKRDKIIKFAGCYHGHVDSMLVQGGSGLLTTGISSSLGVPEGVVKDTLVAQYNNLEEVEILFKTYPEQIAGIIVEPVAANMGLVLPKAGFLEGLRKVCTQYGAQLIFDEVITGFRLGFGGAQEYFGIQADIVAYGKIIGGGLPVGAYGGTREIMGYVSPLGGVYQGGTLSGNPLAMAGGLATLKILGENPEIYKELEKKGKYLKENLEKSTPLIVSHIASLVGCFCAKKKVENYKDAIECDTKEYSRLFHHLKDKGILIAPAQFETLFLCTEHTWEELERTVSYFAEFYQ